MANPAAHRRNFEHLPEAEQLRYAELLRQLDRLGLGCRCEIAGAKDFQVVVGFGFATAKYWLNLYGLT